MFDGTPDVSQNDQMSEVIRYVSITKICFNISVFSKSGKRKQLTLRKKSGSNWKWMV